MGSWRNDGGVSVEEWDMSCCRLGMPELVSERKACLKCVDGGRGGISRDPPDRQTGWRAGLGRDNKVFFPGSGILPPAQDPSSHCSWYYPQDARPSPPPVLLTSIFLHIPRKVSSFQHWLTIEMPPLRKTQTAKVDTLQPCLCGLV